MPPDFVTEVIRLSGQPIQCCYHCLKCTAGCPVVEAMTYGPANALRMISLGQVEHLLHSKDIWLCAGCFTCATRCPNEIDIAAVMDALRQMAVRQKIPASERDVLLFHRLFLGAVRLLGRSHEAAVLGLFKFLSHTPLPQDLPAGIGLFLRGKVPLLPHRIRNTRQVQNFFHSNKQT